MSGSTLYLLDTNMTGYIARGRSAAAREQLERAMQSSVVAMSAISRGEILFGLEQRPAATRLRTLMDDLFRRVRVLAWDSAAAESYAKLRTRLNAEGKSLAPMDMLIAAHAIAVGAVLVTKDAAFAQVTPLLDVVDWADDVSLLKR